MSKDQLSWEQILSGSAAEKAPEPTSSGFAQKDWSKLEFKKATHQTSKQASDDADNTAVNSVSLQAKVEAKIEAVVADTGVVSELVTTPEPLVAPEPTVLSVSQLNKNIREILEGRFPLLWLKAEISNFKAHTSGHFYFSLKDSKAQISAVMFKGFNAQLRFRPEDGMEVLVRGKVTVYEPRGNYQIFCESMEPVGAGALQKAFEQLKAKLQREGLFDVAKKRLLPALPRHIAIVTSPTGAAIRDMLNVLGRRFKGARITVIPCKVQGDQAGSEIIRAIALANALLDVDVMIVGRGGGSIEDLWAFNEEGVARAIASTRVPVISAVGHEIDFTIADFVADLRAPTPSAAAELVVKNAADLTQQLTVLSRALRLAVYRQIANGRQSVTSHSKRLLDPQRRIQDAALRCDELLQRLESGTLRSLQVRRSRVQLLQHKLGTPLFRVRSDQQKLLDFDRRLRGGVRSLLIAKQNKLTQNMAVLDSLSPLRVLDRGFSMVQVGERIITDAEELSLGQTVRVRMCRGSIEAQVSKVNAKANNKE